MTRRSPKPQVTKAELARALAALKDAGVKLATAEILPGKVLFTTTDGKNLTLPDAEADLDAELAEHRRKRGHG